MLRRRLQDEVVDSFAGHGAGLAEVRGEGPLAFGALHWVVGSDQEAARELHEVGLTITAQGLDDALDPGAGNAVADAPAGDTVPLPHRRTGLAATVFHGHLRVAVEAGRTGVHEPAHVHRTRHRSSSRCRSGTPAATPAS